MNLITIKKSLQPDIISSFWTMLRECEGQAENDNDCVLKHQVEGYYRQWNLMTGDEKEPRWVTIEKVVEVFYTDEVVSTGDPRQLESEYRLRVRAVIIEQLGLTELELVDTNTLSELGADSLDEIEIVMALEDEFKIEISDAQAETMRTVNDVVAWLVNPQ